MMDIIQLHIVALCLKTGIVAKLRVVKLKITAQLEWSNNVQSFIVIWSSLLDSARFKPSVNTKSFTIIEDYKFNLFNQFL